MEYLDIKDCVYSDSSGVIVDCDVLTDSYGWVPTTVNMESDSRAKLVVMVSNSNVAEYTPPEKTTAEKVAEINYSVQVMMNQEAQKKGYDNIHTAALRAALPNSPYYSEGVLYGEWMDQCNFKQYELLSQFQSGEIGEMTPEEVLSVMPPCPVQVQ